MMQPSTLGYGGDRGIRIEYSSLGGGGFLENIIVKSNVVYKTTTATAPDDNTRTAISSNGYGTNHVSI